MIFTIDTSNGIMIHATQGTTQDGAASFSTLKEFERVSADWPAARLIGVWNGFAGAVRFDDLKPVKKFTNRQTGVKWIWEAIQRMKADVPAPVPDTAPKKGKSKEQPTAESTAAQAPPEEKAEARDGSKKAQVLELMRRQEGVTLAEIMQQTGWQSHTVRGFVSGTLTKKLGLTVESFRNVDKDRVYRIA